MKVSIIIPVHNCEKFVENCVNNLIKTTKSQLEIVLIDDHSTDSSYDICNRMSKDKLNVKVIKNHRKGVSEARNIGLQNAIGDIIGFCDADDYYEPYAIDYIVDLFNMFIDIDIIVTAFNVISENENIKWNQAVRKAFQCKANQLISHVLIDDNIMGSVWNKFFRKKIVRNIKFDESLSYCEDMYFVMKTLSMNRNAKCYITNKPTYNYVRNNNSVTNTVNKFFDSNNELKYIIAIKKIIQDCSLDRSQMIDAECKITCLAIDALEEEVNTQQKILLINEIKNIFPSFIKRIFKSNIKKNLKRSIMLIRILIR